MSLFVTPAKLLLIIDDVITFLNMSAYCYFLPVPFCCRKIVIHQGFFFACAVNRGKLSVSIQQYLRPMSHN